MLQHCESPPWLARLRALLLAALFLILGSCAGSEPITQPEGLDNGSISGGTDSPSLAIGYAGGIPFGMWDLPSNQIGSIYNGALRNARILIETGTFHTTLAAIKSRGGKVVLQLTGHHKYYLDANGHFSMTKWKERLNMFKGVNFSSYITDGTIIAHMLIDEPSDASNWGGVPVSQATVEAMAKYSKQLWPGMATLARVESTYLAQWSGTYQYLDGAWAQWVARKGDPLVFINRNVTDAKKKGLSLGVGLNTEHGYFGQRMSASLIKSAGSALLSSTYPCTFLSWTWDGEEVYLTTTAVKDAMKYLRAKAQNRTFKSCKS